MPHNNNNATEPYQMLRTKCKSMEAPSIPRISSKERKLALVQDVDRLKKRLRHEENIHRALERAFTRPLGSLPRLPPYLPPSTLELLAEVAVLEEEVVRLEEQIVVFRKGLYEEAVNISSAKKNVENSHFDSNDSEKDEQKYVIEAADMNSISPSKSQIDYGKEKENQSSSNSTRIKVQSPNQKQQTMRTPTKKLPLEKKTPEKSPETRKSQLHCRTYSQDNGEAKSLILQDERKLGDESPNAIAESMLKCLLSIFSRMSTSKNRLSMDKFPPFVPENGGGIELLDPYDVWPKFRKRDIGPYKNLCSVDARSINLNRTANSTFLIRRLRQVSSVLSSHFIAFQDYLAHYPVTQSVSSEYLLQSLPLSNCKRSLTKRSLLSG
ncbi:Rho GTPase-activating protein REN1 [Bienertia sinuspersici]